MTHRPSDAAGFGRLADLVPAGPAWSIDWRALWALWPELPALDACPQDPSHHAEGDVGIHTRMVAEALVADPDWRGLGRADRAGLFWAVVLHDIGKPATTKREEDGRLTARGHARLGAAMARRLLWAAGAPFAWREAVCGLIASHLLPFWLIERPDAERRAIEASWRCTGHHLCLHARADATGRICDDQAAILEAVELARVVFEEAECLQAPFSFANDESRVAYFERPDRNPRFAAHEDFRCRVTVMAGLPGSGKDTWIARHLPDRPVVSLDQIRDRIGAPPTGDQGAVIQAAREQARIHLRAGQDFVWNATNVSHLVRSKVLGLLRDYGAHIHIVYIEVPPDRLFRRNAARAQAVPANVILDLVGKLEPPGEWEAHQVTRVLDARPGRAD